MMVRIRRTGVPADYYQVQLCCSFFEQHSNTCSIFAPTYAVTIVLPACPYSIFATPGIPRHTHPEGEPCTMSYCTYDTSAERIVVVQMVDDDDTPLLFAA